MAPIETEIPVIDLSKLTTDFNGVAKEIKDVAGSWGFLYVKNHGVDQEKIDRMFEIVSLLCSVLVFYRASTAHMIK